MKIAIGCDHGGYELKEQIKEYLSNDLKVEFEDFGTYRSSDFGSIANKSKTQRHSLHRR